MNNKFSIKPINIAWGLVIGVWAWVGWIHYNNAAMKRELENSKAYWEWQARNDQAEWEHALKAKSKASYRGYLSRNRLGKFSDDARKALQEISKKEQQPIFVLFEPTEPVTQLLYGDEIRGNVRAEIIGAPEGKTYNLGIRLSSPNAEINLIHPRQVSTSSNQAFWGISGFAHTPGPVELHAVLEDYSENHSFPIVRDHKAVWFTIEPTIQWYLSASWFAWIAAAIGAILQSYISHLVTDKKTEKEKKKKTSDPSEKT